MFSGLAGAAAGWLAGLFKRKGGRVSAYRIVLVATLATLGWGFWAGWVQWVVLGEGLADSYLDLVSIGTFLARWAMVSWIVIILLWMLVDDRFDLCCISIPVSLMICFFGTLMQEMCIRGAFDPPPPNTHYSVTVSCRHCDAECRARVKIGESWTDWDSVKCARCGIAVPPEMVPEYAKAREAWEARVTEHADIREVREAAGADGTD